MPLTPGLNPNPQGKSGGSSPLLGVPVQPGSGGTLAAPQPRGVHRALRARRLAGLLFSTSRPPLGIEEYLSASPEIKQYMGNSSGSGSGESPFHSKGRRAWDLAVSGRGRSPDPCSLGHGQGSAAPGSCGLGRKVWAWEAGPGSGPSGSARWAGTAGRSGGERDAQHEPCHQRWGRHQMAHPWKTDWLGRDPTSLGHSKTWTLLPDRAHPCQPGWACALLSSAKAPAALTGRRGGMKSDTGMMTGGL